MMPSKLKGEISEMIICFEDIDHTYEHFLVCCHSHDNTKHKDNKTDPIWFNKKFQRVSRQTKKTSYGIRTVEGSLLSQLLSKMEKRAKKISRKNVGPTCICNFMTHCCMETAGPSPVFNWANTKYCNRINSWLVR